MQAASATLRRVLATSWKSEDRIQPIWDRLPVAKGRREELARLTGISASNLSAMNRGRMSITMDTVERIAAVVPGVTAVDLGAPEAAAVEAYLTVDQRLESLASELADAVERTTRLGRRVTRLQERLRILEARPWPAQGEATGTDG